MNRTTAASGAALQQAVNPPLAAKNTIRSMGPSMSGGGGGVSATGALKASVAAAAGAEFDPFGTSFHSSSLSVSASQTAASLAMSGAMMGATPQRLGPPPAPKSVVILKGASGFDSLI